MFTIIMATQPGEKKPSVFARGGTLSYCAREGVSFAVLRLRSAQNIHWGPVRRRLGNSSGRIICGPGIQLPEKRDLLPLDCRRYAHLMTQNALLYLLGERAAGSGPSGTATLIDLGCRHWAFADILVRFFKMVRIVTRNCELYESYVEQKLSHQGAAMVVSSSLPEGDGTQLYVSPEPVFWGPMETAGVPVVTSSTAGTLQGGSASYKMPVLSDFRAPTPEQYAFAPEGIDPFFYQAALFECCGAMGLRQCVPTSARLSGQEKSMEEIKMFLFSVDKPKPYVYN